MKCFTETIPDSFVGVCNGRAFCGWNILCFPFVALYNSSCIYFWPCFYQYFTRIMVYIICLPCTLMGISCCTGPFRDTEFPAESRSLGGVCSGCSRPSCGGCNKNKSNSKKLRNLIVLEGLNCNDKDAQVNEKVEWVRIPEYFKRAGLTEEGDGPPQLFYEGIEPDDIMQGDLGNCWLLAAVAALARFPQMLHRLFITKEFNELGKYQVRLFDMRKNDWFYITVDDYIPIWKDGAKAGTPCFCNPSGREMWVFLLEKAVAKWCGGYSSLGGGHFMWAMAALTGDNCFLLKQDTDGASWMEKRLKYFDLGPNDSPKSKVGMADAWDDYNGCYSSQKTAQVWDTLLMYHDLGSVMSCGISTGGGGESQDQSTGIVAGHAYSLLQVVESSKFKLLQLRNPWGNFEAKGMDWCDTSDMWGKYPEVATACEWTKETDKDDGVFWISFEDFCKRFNKVEICDRSTTVDTLCLEVDETDYHCGVFKGCICGCMRFWCLLEGIVALYCPHRSQDKIIEPSCWDCICPCIGVCGIGVETAGGEYRRHRQEWADAAPGTAKVKSAGAH